MIFGFFTDSHGDLEATKTCLAALREADSCLFLGDVAGGREVHECIRLMRQQANLAVVVGNHDLYDFELIGLQAEDKGYLASLPIEVERGDFLAVHSTYTLDSAGKPRFSYVLNEEQAGPMFLRFKQRLVFFGHSHLNQIYELQPDQHIKIHKLDRAPLALVRDNRYLICVAPAAEGVVFYDSIQQWVRFLSHGGFS